ncbi:peptidoglycan-binding domain-containing protein, partial [Bifidobacterium bifidum]
RRWQQVMGTSVDGIISGQYRPDGRTWGRPALVDSCVRYGGGGSNLIRAVQRKLNLTADGLLGPATIRALQKHLGVAQDSWFGPGTARALQSRLNTGRF